MTIKRIPDIKPSKYSCSWVSHDHYLILRKLRDRRGEASFQLSLIFRHIPSEADMYLRSRYLVANAFSCLSCVTCFRVAFHKVFATRFKAKTVLFFFF